jgi:hypothetical protein
MSVFYPIISIIVRKTPNSLADALTRSQAPTPFLPGHRPHGRPGDTSSIVALPLAANGGGGGDDDDHGGHDHRRRPPERSLKVAAETHTCSDSI